MTIITDVLLELICASRPCYVCPQGKWGTHTTIYFISTKQKPHLHEMLLNWVAQFVFLTLCLPFYIVLSRHATIFSGDVGPCLYIRRYGNSIQNICLVIKVNHVYRCIPFLMTFEPLNQLGHLF